MRITRYAANLHSAFLLRLFPSVPLRLYAHSPFPIALNNNNTNNNNNVDYAVASFITLLNNRDAPSQVEFDQILGSLVKINQYHTAVSLFAQMDFRGISPSLINCFCHLGLMDSAFSALAKNIKLGHQLDVFTYNALIDGYFLINRVNEAAKMFDSTIKAGLAPDVHSYSIMINGYCKNKMVDQAITFFKESESFVPNIGIYTLIDRLCKSGRISCVQNILDEMHESEQPPKLVGYCILLDALCKIQHLDEAIALFHNIIHKGFRPNAYMCSILLNGLCKCGRVRTARELFEHLLANNYCLDVVNFNIMMSGFVNEGLIDEAIDLFLKMKGHGCLPNTETYSLFYEAFRQFSARNKHMLAVTKSKEKKIFEKIGKDPRIW
ncbi:hypothetical protein Ahy_B04g068961 [Arachis hypogaea]|uniref:Pentatricopeptide repeat-containing protein n=3 Tax=Arachis TaxID=3817 RepID=A0A444ZBF3_ARAHY|nr:hypothetical protein Ahy_B04g068961 [Arachis hypogaea]